MQKICLLLFLTLALFACKSEPSENILSEEDKKPVEEKKDFEDIQELFEATAFKDTTELALLKEIQICSADSNLIKKGAIACDPGYFKFFPLIKGGDLNNGFILLVKAGTGGFPLRRLLIFQRERGKLIKVNGFVSNLIGRVPTKSGYDDLLLRFNDKDGTEDMFYNCLFTWNGSQYIYKQVEVIEGRNWGGRVKAELKDSISNEIYQNILNNKMIF
ncbi:MAG: hypothetical protein N4A41_03475 [Crocinitomicaceae bacterium]|jgi:hypothetical protein|nr:hypothetical protein [Crocinitomicaceae bacterium]